MSCETCGGELRDKLFSVGGTTLIKEVIKLVNEKKKLNPNMAILHCVIHKDDHELLKSQARYHGEITNTVRSLIRLYCNKVRSKEITVDSPLSEVFTNKKIEEFAP